MSQRHLRLHFGSFAKNDRDRSQTAVVLRQVYRQEKQSKGFRKVEDHGCPYNTDFSSGKRDRLHLKYTESNKEYHGDQHGGYLKVSVMKEDGSHDYPEKNRCKHLKIFESVCQIVYGNKRTV